MPCKRRDKQSLLMHLPYLTGVCVDNDEDREKLEAVLRERNFIGVFLDKDTVRSRVHNVLSNNMDPNVRAIQSLLVGVTLCCIP